MHEQEKGKDFHFTSPPVIKAGATGHVQLVEDAVGIWSYGDEKVSPGFLNKCIGILENHSKSLSFFQFLFILGGIEKKRGTQNDSIECQ